MPPRQPRKYKQRRKKRIVEQKVKWDSVPTLADLQGVRPTPFEPMSDTERLGFMTRIGIGYSHDDYLTHETYSIDEVRRQYQDAGFQTDRILQDPRGHPGPTTACAIGFPSNLPQALWNDSLRIFKRFICRVHVDIVTLDGGELASVPHVEPDAYKESWAHLELSWAKGLVVTGKPAVSILRYFLDL